MRRILNWLGASAKKYNESADFQPAEVEIPRDVELIPDVPYSGVSGNALAADIYRPAGPGASGLPVAVVVHGGGLFAGDRTINRPLCIRLAQEGHLVFALEYRLISEADAYGEISDLCAGYEFVRNSLEDYGGDLRRVAVMAESAGAFLAVYATAMAGSEALPAAFGCAPSGLLVRALICFSGMFYTGKTDPIGLVYRKELYGSRRRERAIREMMDPEHPEIVTHLPPVLLTSSRGDFLRHYTLQYERALRGQGHPCELIYYPQGKHLPHAFPSLDPSLPESREVLERILTWLGGVFSGNEE